MTHDNIFVRREAYMEFVREWREALPDEEIQSLFDEARRTLRYDDLRELAGLSGMHRTDHSTNELGLWVPVIPPKASRRIPTLVRRDQGEERILLHKVATCSIRSGSVSSTSSTGDEDSPATPSEAQLQGDKPSCRL